MTYIIAEPCVDVLDRACIDVCPVDCIYEAEEHNILLINPEECIDLRSLRTGMSSSGDFC